MSRTLRFVCLLAAAAASEAWSSSFLAPSLRGQGSFISSPPFCSNVAQRPPSTLTLGLSMEFLGFKLSSLGGIGDMIQKAEASHILVKGPQSLEGCNDLKELVVASIDYPAGRGLEDAFKGVAEKYSSCPSASKGGYLGSFKPGQMVSEFDEVVFTRAVGTLHGPIKTQFGG
mmetsp:Transcript_36761/g.89355  ORF Transcript_36761/g.89355 Transcript_36761/m.89355 type:complete len:172 (-) Transcript_36761:8-523(-)